jgi:hypothetical protein
MRDVLLPWLLIRHTITSRSVRWNDSALTTTAGRSFVP